MAQRCCDHHISCPGAGNLDFDAPLANLSSERPDVDYYIGLNYGWDWFTPWLGSNWTRNTCVGVCTSEISQEDADLCAQRANLICLNNDNWGTPPNPPPINPGVPKIFIPDQPRQLFSSNIATCTKLCPDGIGFSYTVPPGRYLGYSQIMVDRMALSDACRFASEAKLCLGAIDTSACVGLPHSDFVHLSGNPTPPVSYEIINGSLPPGMTFATSTDGLSFIIGGTPTASGSYTFTVRAQDSIGRFMQKTYTLNVMEITPSSLTDAQRGTPYSQQLTAVGATAPYTYEVVNGSLPDGMTMNVFGLVSGTPTTEESSTFTVRYTDALGEKCVKEYTLTVLAPSNCPNWALLQWPSGVDPLYPLVTSTGGGSAIVIPLAAQSDTCTAESTAPNPGDTAAAANDALIAYNGTGCNCNMHVDLAASGPNLFLELLIFDAITLIQVLFFLPPNPAALAPSFDLPFALPNTLGVQHFYRVILSTGALIGAGGQHIACSITLSNP